MPEKIYIKKLGKKREETESINIIK